MYIHTHVRTTLNKRWHALPYAKVLSMHTQWPFIRQAHPTMPYIQSLQFVPKLAFIIIYLRMCMRFQKQWSHFQWVRKWSSAKVASSSIFSQCNKLHVCMYIHTHVCLSHRHRGEITTMTLRLIELKCEALTCLHGNLVNVHQLLPDGGLQLTEESLVQ